MSRTEKEIEGILDAIKAMTGGYVARGEEVTQTPQMSKHDPLRQAWDFEGDGETKQLLYNYSEPKPYEAELTREEVRGILEALSKQPHYRPMPEQGSPAYDIELMKRYPQFFGF